MIALKDLITLERFLLEINSRFKFQLKFAEVIELNNFIEEVSNITNLFFTLQEEYYRKFGDNDSLAEYHDKLMNEKVKINTSKMIAFVKGVFNRFADDEFGKIVIKNKFWD